MAGQNTILFLFNSNDLKQNTENKVTFIFGDPPKPCEYPIQIDKTSNLFDASCCRYIDYDTNIININCDTGTFTPDCIFWKEQEPGIASFDCPCIPWQQESDGNANFNINCTSGGGPSTPTIILDTTRNYFGSYSNTYFSIDISNVTSALGYYISFDMSIANMRIDTSSYVGFYAESTLIKIALISVDLITGFAASSTIVYDPYHKFFTNQSDSASAYFDYDAKSTILYNPYHLFFANQSDATSAYFNYAANSTIVYNPYHKFSEVDLTIPWGIDSKSAIVYNPYHKFSEVDLTIPWGVDSKSTIVYNPYHKFSESDLTIPWGITSTAFILYNQYTVMLEGDITTTFETYESKAVLVYDPYHEFFTNSTDSTKAVFGMDAKSSIVYDPYHEFFTNQNAAAISSFGFDVKNVFVYNPYNQFNPDTINPFIADWISRSDMRYNDDHRITPDDINLAVGIDSSSGMKLANIYANVGTNLSYGYSVDSSVQYTPGFVGSSYLGYATNIKYLTYRIPYPTFGTIIAGFGYELHNNGQKPRYFDLSANVCCTKDPYELIHIEMTNQDGWDVLYGNENGWGIACVASLCAQPRMTSTLNVGFTSSVEDKTVYLGKVEFIHGTHVRARGLQFDSIIELGNGNFITDQNEIKIELTKPDDVFTSNYVLYMGSYINTNLGATYGLRPYGWYYGHYMTAEMRVEEALRGQFYFGIGSYFTLNNTSRMSATEYMGFTSNVKFYEAPYYMYYGFISTCESIITENWVEFLEEGELNNNYLFQTKNGDIDLTRPNGESIEGYPYNRYIKGRCY